MTHRRFHASSDSGIALVEALASLVIVGMIALMLAAGASTGRRVWERLGHPRGRGRGRRQRPDDTARSLGTDLPGHSLRSDAALSGF